MAYGCSLVNSASPISNCVIDRSFSLILEHKKCSNLSYNGIRIKWLWSYDLLKNFVELGIKLHGDWRRLYQARLD
jgi:hypothetical protein